MESERAPAEQPEQEQTQPLRQPEDRASSGRWPSAPSSWPRPASPERETLRPAAWPHPQPEESATESTLPFGFPPTPSDAQAGLPSWRAEDATPSVPDEAASRRTGGRLIPLFLAALLGSVIGTGATLVATDSRSGGEVRVAPPVPGGTTGKAGGVATVAAAVMPSIVRIDTSAESFFGRQQTGTGSGVIYRSDGYIITNNHVVQGATDVNVTLSTGEELEGRVIGTAAPVDDIAVVKVDRTGLPSATLGSILTTKVGEPAIALGSPFGLQGTVTAGIVSALHRSIDLGDVSFTEAIQTDAPINPGNSGGALVNERGEVIGINTAIVGGSGGNVGIGFAIPIDIAKRDAEEIIETGTARRPLLGLTPATIPNQKGAYVEQVGPGSPAAKAGIKAGDVIVRVNDREIASGEELILAITQFRVGQTVRVTFVRDGKSQTVNATLAARR